MFESLRDHVGPITCLDEKMEGALCCIQAKLRLIKSANISNWVANG